MHDAGVPTAVYSAVADDTHRTNVLLARSDREMRVWQQDRSRWRVRRDDPSISHVRDPFVFKVDGHGTHSGCRTHRWGPVHPGVRVRRPVRMDGAGQTAVRRRSGRRRGGAGQHLGVSDLVRFADRWVLILSLWRRVDGRFSLAGVRYLLGDLAVGPDGPRFAPTSGGLLSRCRLLRAAGAAGGRPRPAVGVVPGARPCPAGHHGRRLGRGAHVLPGAVPGR